MKKIVFLIYFFGFLVNCSEKLNLNLKKNEDNFILQRKYYVVFDQSKEQIYSPYEKTYSGFSKLTNYLRKNDVSVSINNLPLPEFFKTFKGNDKILMLGVAVEQEYTEIELKSIINFVNGGGNIVVFVEHENMFNNQKFQNKLIENYGIQALPDLSFSVGKTITERQWTFCKSVKFGLNRIRLYLPAPLNVSGKAEPLLKIINPLTKNLEIVGAINEVSKGKVVVIGDIELFWNGTDKIGLMDSDNLKFAEKLFNYLVKDKNKVIFKPPQKNKNKLNILYDISKGQILPDKSPGGTYEFVNFLINYGYNVDILKSDNIDYKKYDVIIENNPLEKFKTDKILSGKRFILLNDGQADLINDRETYIVLKKWCGVNYNKEDAYLPNNFIAENFGFKIMSNTVINDNKNRFFLNINFLNDKFKIYRSASIKINKDRTKCKIIGKTYSRITNNFIPIQSEGNLNFQNSPFYELKNFKENFNIIVADREVLLFADCDLLSNQILDINKHKLLLKTIVDWIDFPDKLLK